MVNSKKTSDYISHVSGEEEVEFSEDPSEILIHGENLQPVTLSDYTRNFSHVMSDHLMPEEWRYDTTLEMIQSEYSGTENRGALNIEEKGGEEINAILVPMTDEELEFYDSRELGYHLERIEEDNLDASVNLDVIAAVSHNTGEAEPIKGYVEECLESWSDWSEEHRDRFLETTQVGG